MTEPDSDSKTRLNAEEVKARIKDTCSNVIDKVCAVIPDDVAEHLGNSKNELLLAIRSLIDDEIERTGKSVDRVKDAGKEN